MKNKEQFNWLKDKKEAKERIAQLEFEQENFTHDLKVYLSYKEYDAVIELAKILNLYKIEINNIKEKYDL